MANTLLTIDDDNAITELLAIILRSHGFDVLVANDGEDGIRIIKEKSPQLVILDLMMPNMDGWQVCKAVRNFSSIPIMVLSALDDPAVVASVLDAGADDYLVKPIPSAVLVAHINKLCRRTGMLYPPANKDVAMRPNTQPLSR
ncbi:MAG: response regulator [Chloroflexi bacterium]|nr:response regulator [Chloroflexota bacterium]